MVVCLGGGSYLKIVKWFWEVMGGFEKEQLARVLQFVTGTSGVPSQGFAVLQVIGRGLRLST